MEIKIEETQSLKAELELSDLKLQSQDIRANSFFPPPNFFFFFLLFWEQIPRHIWSSRVHDSLIERMDRLCLGSFEQGPRHLSGAPGPGGGGGIAVEACRAGIRVPCFACKERPQSTCMHEYASL